jgi:colanic acid/amylovoran biosynthesis protein
VLIEIKGVQFVNKGAALMLEAIRDRLQRSLPQAEIALIPGVNAPFASIGKIGAWHRFSAPGAPIDLDALSYRLPQRARGLMRRYGIVTEADIDAVLDASGFAYGAVWGDAPLAATAREITRLARRGKPYVFLPQAFGPFNDAVATREFGRALGAAALVCAREARSRDHVASIAPALGDRLAVVPDFTIGLAGSSDAAARHGVDRGTALIVPNVHMQDERNPDVAWRKGYVPLLTALGRHLAERGFTVRVVNHEGAADAALCATLAGATGSGPVLSETDPLALKGVLGGAGLVVSSRYHGCVNALSQAVPCLGTAWSHKYAALFDDFGADGHILTSCDVAASVRLLDELLDSRAAVTARLTAARPALVARVDAMWDRVFDVLRPAAVR